MYPINSKITRGLNSFFLPKIAGYFRVRIIFECGLNSFFFGLEKKMFIRRSKKGRYFRYDDSLLPLIDFQQLSKLQNILIFSPKNSETPANSQFFKIHKTFADYFRVRIEFFFSLKNCGLFSSADYFRVNWVCNFQTLCF